MAVTIDQIAQMLAELGLKYEKKSDTVIITAFHTKKYRHPGGAQALPLVIELSENGEYFKVFSPMAFQIQGEHVDAFLKACMMIQWKTKLIQFEYDANDGEIRPIVEFPIEDGTITKAQLQRCLYGITQIVDEFYPTLEKAARTGEIEFPDDPTEQSLSLLLRLAQRIASGEALSAEERSTLESLIRSRRTNDSSDEEGPDRL